MSAPRRSPPVPRQLSCETRWWLLAPTISGEQRRSLSRAKHPPSEPPGWQAAQTEAATQKDVRWTVYFPIRSAALLTDYAALRGSIPSLIGASIAVATTHRHGCRRPLRHASLDDQPVCATVKAQARALHRGNKAGDNIHIARTSRTPHPLCGARMHWRAQLPPRPPHPVPLLTVRPGDQQVPQPFHIALIDCSVPMCIYTHMSTISTSRSLCSIAQWA